MRITLLFCVSAASLALTTSALADEPATGLLLSARLPTGLTSSINLASAGGLIGYRFGNLTVGADLGGARYAVTSDSDTHEESYSATILSAAPFVAYDVWSSRDGRARANLFGSVGLGRAWISEEDRYRLDARSNWEDEQSDESSATVLPLRAGVGGDYYLARNFALGLETGLSGLFLLDMQSDDSTRKESANAGGLYAAVRATLVLGD